MKARLVVNGMKIDSCKQLLQWALPRMGYRWDGFRRVYRQVCRKIRARMAELGLHDHEAYRRRLEEDPGEWKSLDRCCPVSISRFARDLTTWNCLRRRILPELVDRCRRSGDMLRLLSLGCASGEEPYSISILMHEDVPGAGDIPWRILAFDRHLELLARVRRGRYPASSLSPLEPELAARAFEADGDELVLREKYKHAVRIAAMDIREALPRGRFPLILCRNMAFTYFAREEQERTLARLLEILEPGGFLVIGAKESLPALPPAFEPVDGAPGVFRRS